MAYVRHIFSGVQSGTMHPGGWCVFTDTDGSFRRHAKTGIKEGAVIGFIPEEDKARQVCSFAKAALGVSNLRFLYPATCLVINDDVEIGRLAGSYFPGPGLRTAVRTGCLPDGMEVPVAIFAEEEALALSLLRSTGPGRQKIAEICGSSSAIIRLLPSGSFSGAPKKSPCEYRELLSCAECQAEMSF